ncbi:DUF6221 family protein [Streptomyces sp. NRRL F-5650]|uniref:DUF6221 family protein n=1 Tax=Streptomyces sp. NRRL F-5650 TaxID=1463868 RepID=UPI0004CC2465|nr:DUF6221 family protein [Streptomyces sp. NRRL F-5650]
MNDEFLQWLREQLDDDERTARAATDGPWTTMGQRVLDPSPPSNRLGIGMAVGHAAASADYNETAEHIARHDPARVLAEVEAKRGVLRQYTDLREQVRNPVSAENRSRARALQGEIGDVLRLLALPYADRPGYRDEWRP